VRLTYENTESFDQMIILLISPLPPPTGGISTWSKNILEYSASNIQNYRIIHQDTASRSKEITKVDFFNRWYYGIREFIRVRAEVKKNIAINMPDIIHLTSSGSLALLKDYALLKIAKRRNIFVVMHWHFGRIPGIVAKKNWEWFLLNKIIRSCAASVVIDGKSMLSLKGAGYTNLFEIPNPIGTDVEQKIHLNSDDQFNDREGSILFVGHVVRNKGVYELIEACTQLDLVKQLTLAGPYEIKTRNELFDIAKKRDHGKWLKLTGGMDKDDILRLMGHSQLLILPSYSEGFPNVILEAMSMGCPVIATCVGAIPEMLAAASDKPCGICIPIKDVLQLSEAIVTLLNDPERCKEMGINGKERVLEYFTINKVMKKYETVWVNILSG